MSTFDVYGATDKLNDMVLDAIVTRLEARGKHRFFQKMMNEYLDAMDIDSANTVLDFFRLRYRGNRPGNRSSEEFFR